MTKSNRTSWSCRLGRHQWVKRQTEDGRRYADCSRCGKLDERVYTGVAPL